jgi:hypothetical protein
LQAEVSYFSDLGNETVKLFAIKINRIIFDLETGSASEMKDLYILPTTKTPEIDFQKKGVLKITGNSYPENVNQFYGEIMIWLDQFLELNTEIISINVDLTYINTSSTKAILNIIGKINAAAKSRVKVSWIYEIEDAEMYEAGREFEKLSNLKFDFIEK